MFVSSPYDRAVLPVGELVAVSKTVDDEGSSPLALRIARSWRGCTVRFLRSSANHVFVCDVGVLRFRPGDHESVRRVAETASCLAEAGISLAQPMRTAEGELVVSVDRYAATMSNAVAGRQVDEGSLTPDLARAWGAGLARFHDAASRESPDVPSWLDSVAAAAHALRHEGIVDDVQRLPSGDELVGVVHGDPELDNVIWTETGEPVFVDLDDVSRSWFAADVAFALRDFVDSPLAKHFVAGYREGRPLTDDELTWLPLFRRAHALVTLARLQPALAEPVADDWPDWARALHARVGNVAAELRANLA
jgi:Ser/Thr protein kinase RdoA (MazF antagonist)